MKTTSLIIMFHYTAKIRKIKDRINQNNQIDFHIIYSKISNSWDTCLCWIQTVSRRTEMNRLLHYQKLVVCETNLPIRIPRNFSRNFCSFICTEQVYAIEHQMYERKKKNNMQLKSHSVISIQSFGEDYKTEEKIQATDVWGEEEVHSKWQAPHPYVHVGIHANVYCLFNAATCG